MPNDRQDRDSAEGETLGLTRRRLLECAPWAGTGVLWGLSGGVPYALGLIGDTAAQAAGGFTFLQISDSHIGFAKPVNPDARKTLEETIGRIGQMPSRPNFMIHTGDITHLSTPKQFDDAAQIIGQSRLTTHFVPGEHDVLDPELSEYRKRFGAGTKGAGWYSFDFGGVHFVALVNVMTGGRDIGTVYIDDPGGKAGGLGILGIQQLAWLEDDLRARSASTPIVVFAHIPLWAAYPTWGWGTLDSARALSLLRRFGSVTVLNGHIHQVMQKVEGNIAFHAAMSTAFPQPAPGQAPKPGPEKVPAERLRSMLGATTIVFRQGQQRLAIVDTPLSS